MYWKEVLVMEERCSFVVLATKHERPFSVLCREYGISRKTGYKWVARYEQYGVRSLGEVSRRALNCPLLIKTYGIKSPPAESAIGEILKRNGVSLRKRRKRGVYRRWPHRT